MKIVGNFPNNYNCWVRVIVPMFLLPALLVGCKKDLHLYESKATPTVIVSTNASGTLSLSPRDVASEIVLVTGAVQTVELPVLNSPSLAGDKATCRLLVPAHSIPGYSDFCRIALHYANHGWLQGLKPGMQLVLRFQKNGEFDGVQLPANFIQPSGVTNRSPSGSSQTNRN
jgi:hypothetical protein